jgi:hypothetical protein
MPGLNVVVSSGKRRRAAPPEREVADLQRAINQTFAAEQGNDLDSSATPLVQLQPKSLSARNMTFSEVIPGLRSDISQTKRVNDSKTGPNKPLP